MCRNIRPLFNFHPPSTPDDVRNAALQFVRKISGYSKPSQTNEVAFDLAVNEVSISIQKLMDSLVTNAEPRDREEYFNKLKAQNAKRFGKD